MIPYGRQNISDEDVSAVIETLRSDFLTQGPKIPQFEKAVAEYCGVGHAVAVNSATSALHIACLSLGLGPGDFLWTTPITFVASANCGLYCGASVDFVDIDPETYNMCPGALERKLTLAEKQGQLPKVIIPVHLGGQPCDMRAISALAQEFNIRIIEDASHAIGGKYLGEPIGNCRYSDITIFSFHPVKVITSGEGGMALTNYEHLAKMMSLLSSQGTTREPELMTHSPDGPWYYQQIALGFNYRLTDIQAALGISQLKRLDELVARRHAIARQYDEALKDLPLRIPRQQDDCYSGLHLYIIRLNLNKMSNSHLDVFKSLRQAGIGVNLHYIPIYRQPYYSSMGYTWAEYPESEAYYAEAISLPMYPTLSASDQGTVVSALGEAVR